MTPNTIQRKIAVTAFAFRGYNLTNLGRTAELLAHPVYGPTVAFYLSEASDTASSIVGRRIDLADRVRRGEETTLTSYADAVALIVAAEMAQIRILKEVFGVTYDKARLTFGYSLGEISALCAAGVLTMSDALRIPLALVDDCVALADGVTLGVLFSRGAILPLHDVNRLCLRINSEGQGVMGISAYLSPNSVLLLGQGDTLERFGKRIIEQHGKSIHLRRHGGSWPPMHTPILWQRSIPNRAAQLMHTMPGGFTQPKPEVFSLVTGKASYNDYNARELIHRWIDHPQRLWDAVYETLDRGCERVIHVGPAPNITPSTFERLAVDVDVQTRGRVGVRTLKAIVPHPWLKRLLPQRAALLRAPLVEQVILEDWLLAQKL
jgi:[acyl-carrier-protein] S-malonyltransferase